MSLPTAAEQKGYVKPPKSFIGDRRAWLGGAYCAKHGRGEDANPYIAGVAAQSWIAGYRAQKIESASSTDRSRGDG